MPRSRRLNYGQPINRACPLNRGLVSRWQSLPAGGRGNTQFDLASRNHGTLTNGTTWGGGAIGRPGGWGRSIHSGASSQYIDCGTPSGLYSATECTFMGWGNRDNTGVLWCLGAGTTDAARLEILWFTDGNIYFSVNAVFASYAHSSTEASHHFALVFVGGTRLTLFHDGVQVAETTSSIPATTESVANMGAFFIGQTALSRFTTGWHDDTRVYNRALSASEIHAIHCESRAGSPLTLNWIRTATVFDTAGGAPPASTIRSRLSLLGVGV
jgi:hypothetical protein